MMHMLITWAKIDLTRVVRIDSTLDLYKSGSSNQRQNYGINASNIINILLSLSRKNPSKFQKILH
jgi:hypothetical protein